MGKAGAAFLRSAVAVIIVSPARGGYILAEALPGGFFDNHVAP